MKTLLKAALIGLFVLAINTPALGEIDGVWSGVETISFLGEQYNEMTYSVIFQESDSALYCSDELFGSVPLVKSGNQWVLSSPLETTYCGYRCVINTDFRANNFQ